MKILFSCLITLILVISDVDADVNISQFKLPPGFEISIYADQVPGARQMALGDQKIVYVGTKEQQVYALIPNHDGTHAEKVINIVNNLNTPNGVAYWKGDLYVAEINRVLRYPDITHHLSNPQSEVINHQLPEKAHHGLRVIHFSPDDWLYIAIGMPCNTCDYRNENPLFGTISRMKPDGSNLQIFAKGIRNSVGFDWQPQTQALWFTDNGQDWLGDHLPPDEINIAPKPGMDFGFPYVYGNNTPAPGYTQKPLPLTNFTPSVFNLPAHVAPLGLTFYTGKMFPAKYQQQIFIAEHGSWNSSVIVGYQVISVFIKDNKVIDSKPFLTGWLNGQNVTGRPVDILNMPDGSLLVSDDYAGKIYRISYNTPNNH